MYPAAMHCAVRRLCSCASIGKYTRCWNLADTIYPAGRAYFGTNVFDIPGIYLRHPILDTPGERKHTYADKMTHITILQYQVLYSSGRRGGGDIIYTW